MMLSKEQIDSYLAQGYTMDEIKQAVNEISSESSSDLQKSYREAMASNDSRVSASHTLISSGVVNDNLIKWQLELDSILERVEHMLRGDRPRFVNGNLIFVPPDDVNDKILNDFGVSEVMRTLTMYLNRNTILSNYDEDTINWKVLDFGKEIVDLFYLKYEAMGLDTLEKRKLYPILVREIVDIVHSSFLRALNGGERASLHEARQITQQESIVGNVPSNGGIVRERSIFNPMRFFGGKYH